MLKKIIYMGLVTVSLAICNSCQRGPHRDVNGMHPGEAAAADSGLSSAANRQAMIAELGKNYQHSESGQYRKRISRIAPFNIQLVNGQSFTYKSLVPDKPVVLVYFSAGCEECHRFITALEKGWVNPTDKQWLFITYEPLDSIQSFYKKSGLAKHPQIKMGTEGYSFTVQKYYNVQHFPFVACYDKTGGLTAVYSNTTQPEKLAAQLL